MQPNKSVHRSVAILKLPNVIAVLIAYAQAIITAMTNNPRFPTPVPALALVTAAIAALQSAQSLALARTKGAVTARNDKKAALVALLQQLRMYVQTVADADLENSAAIIQSAGIAVKKAATRKPRVFNAVQAMSPATSSSSPSRQANARRTTGSTAPTAARPGCSCRPRCRPRPA